jgi:hypothetical protein
MGKQVLCCMRNFQQFEYGHVLRELVEQAHEVRLERCQSQCIGCRMQPAAIIEGKWVGFDKSEQIRQYVEEKLS